MPNDFAARPNRVPWPPLIYAAAIGFAFALEGTWPQAAALVRARTPVVICVGLVLMAAGAAFDLSAMFAMSHRRANILPHRAATALVTSGPFALSRNPIYLGNALMLAGAAPAFGNPWFLLLTPAVVALITILAIRREERHLAARFGDAWTAYAEKTPRWIGF